MPSVCCTPTPWSSPSIELVVLQLAWTVYLPPHLSLTTKVLSISHHPGLADHWGVTVNLEMEVVRLRD